ncbi:MAG: M1 family peptidase, partial [Bacteroidia bacterium]|nr:M1 family peptidase [Bacteroidia bacterium]
MNKSLLFICLFGLNLSMGSAQNLRNNPNSNHGNKFEQLGNILPDANTYRTASGAPGSGYWQQQADYKINAFLDEQDLRLHGDEVITYHNNSPDVLTYLWLQLDENQHQPNAESNFFDGNQVSTPLTTAQLDGINPKKNLDGYGVNILAVTDTL